MGALFHDFFFATFNTLILILDKFKATYSKYSLSFAIS